MDIEKEVKDYRNKLIDAITEEDILKFKEQFNAKYKYFKLNIKDARTMLIATKNKEVYNYFNRK